MIVSIHQPDYIPWLGLYYKIAHSDVFVYLDDAQYSNEADHNVNLIKTPQGSFKLKVPVEQHLGDLICGVRTRDELGWKEKHLKTVRMNYSKARFFDVLYPEFEKVILSHSGTIADLNMAINDVICRGFGFKTKFLKSSEMDIKTFREERVIDICASLGADVYLSGNGARSYQDESHFLARGIELRYIDYLPITYTQIWPKAGFLPCMSAIDYIFNCGYDWEYVEREVARLNER